MCSCRTREETRKPACGRRRNRGRLCGAEMAEEGERQRGWPSRLRSFLIRFKVSQKNLSWASGQRGRDVELGKIRKIETERMQGYRMVEARAQNLKSIQQINRTLPRVQGKSGRAKNEKKNSRLKVFLGSIGCTGCSCTSSNADTRPGPATAGGNSRGVRLLQLLPDW